MIIDCHNHSHYVGLGPEGLLAEMDTFGYDVAWLLTWYLPPGEHVPGSERAFNPCNARADGTHGGVTLTDVVQTCQRYPDRFVAGYCPCPTEGDAADLFEAAYHVHGVRVCGEWSYRTLLDDPRAIDLFRRAGQLGCPVVLHMDVPYRPDESGNLVYQTAWYGGGADQLERALQACPETIIVGHAPGFWRFISGDEATDSALYPSGPIMPGGRVLDLLERYPNLWADLSAGSGLGAMKRDTGFARDFLIRYADRLMFGRDNKGNALQTFLPLLNLPDDVTEKLFYRNALRLVPLK